MNVFDKKTLKFALAERIESVDIDAVISDVKPFMKNPKTTEIWSRDYFLRLAELFLVV
jgi:23S rRNA U2552 (ribose-2'-O)-methylase RlmE/FtsJ